jgi:NAD(P)-dependent dehydrogenase (short-subunit alcohol dehydrogenase family)
MPRSLLSLDERHFQFGLVNICNSVCNERCLISIKHSMANEAFTVSRDKLSGPRDSTLLITGGSSGIGLQTAILLHDLGNNVVVVDRAQPHPSAPASLTSSPRFLYQKADITEWKSQRAAFEAAVKKFGGIDGVFVNAGIAEYKDQFFKDELDEDGLLKEPDRRVYDIDLNAANDTARLAIYYLRNKKPGQKKGGSIVMTASLAGYLASAGAPLYSAAKHGKS